MMNPHKVEDSTGMLMMSFFSTLNNPFSIELAILKQSFKNEKKVKPQIDFFGMEPETLIHAYPGRPVLT